MRGDSRSTSPVRPRAPPETSCRYEYSLRAATRHLPVVCLNLRTAVGCPRIGCLRFAPTACKEIAIPKAVKYAAVETPGKSETLLRQPGANCRIVGSRVQEQNPTRTAGARGNVRPADTRKPSGGFSGLAGARQARVFSRPSSRSCVNDRTVVSRGTGPFLQRLRETHTRRGGHGKIPL